MIADFQNGCFGKLSGRRLLLTGDEVDTLTSEETYCRTSDGRRRLQEMMR